MDFSFSGPCSHPELLAEQFYCITGARGLKCSRISTNNSIGSQDARSVCWRAREEVVQLDRHPRSCVPIYSDGSEGSDGPIQFQPPTGAQRQTRHPRRDGGPVPLAPAGALRAWDRLRPAVVCGLLLLALALVFGQTASFDFVNYDDPDGITDNRLVTGELSLGRLVSVFTQRQPRKLGPP